ncbi:MAG: M12 family metallo-peptidase [Planctomycetota bacterium]|jgi:hypothetical protein
MISSGARAAAILTLSIATTATSAPPDAQPRTLTDLADHDAAATVAQGERVRVEQVTLGNGDTVALDLERFEILAPDAVVVVAGAKGQRQVSPPDVVLLRGAVDGAPDSRAFVAISPFGVQGYIERDGELDYVSTGRWLGGEAQRDLVVTNARDMDPDVVPPACGVLDSPNDVPPPPASSEGGIAGTPCRIARVAVETDYQFTANTFGGDASAAGAYAITLMGASGEIFASNINVHFSITFLRLWESNDDPYTDDSDGLLNEFRDYWVANEGAVERDIAHLLSGRTNLPYGGVAWLGTVCNPNWGYAVSAYLNGTFPYPLESHNGGNWDITVVSHELGHNFGTPHTHNFNPPIDGCGNGDCSDAFGGTIMSYCHTCSGGMTNIDLDFHPLVESTMLFYLNSEGTCLDDTGGAVGVDDFVTTTPDVPVDIDVLENDFAASCDPDDVVITLFTANSVEGGTVELLEAAGPDGRDLLRYTPAPGFQGSDTFAYKLVASNNTIVHIDVIGLRPADVTGSLAPGAEAAYYQLTAPQLLPDFETLEPIGDEIVDNVDYASTGGTFAGSGLADNVGAVFSGYLEVPADGFYTLYAESDDGSRLLIGDQQVVINDGIHGMVEKQGTIGLEAGMHAIRVEFFEAGGGAGLIVRWQSDEIAKQVIPSDTWHHGTGCIGDLDSSGDVSVTDLVALITDWGLSGVPADLDQDGIVDVNDLVALILAWGACS